MASYRITEAARADLQRIYRRGVQEYGDAQADRYFEAFFERFEDLAAQPYAYPAVNEIRYGYRRSVCGVDSIYYRVMHDIVEIMRILGRQDVEEWLWKDQAPWLMSGRLGRCVCDGQLTSAL